MKRLYCDTFVVAFLFGVDLIISLILDHPGLENVIQIEKFQEKAYMEFQDYVTKVYPDDTYRCV